MATAGCSWVKAWQIISTLVSANTFKLLLGSPKRLARIATCDNDSSPVMYSALPARL